MFEGQVLDERAMVREGAGEQPQVRDVRLWILSVIEISPVQRARNQRPDEEACEFVC